MPDICALCGHDADGRALTTSDTHAYYACYDCLPYGIPDSESIHMPKTKPAVIASAQDAARNAVMIKKGQSILAPVASLPLDRIESEEDFALIDSFFGKVSRAMKAWDAEMAPILTPAKATVDHAKATLKGAQALHAKVNTPLEEMMSLCRTLMSDYRRRELALKAAAEDEQRRLLREQERLAEQSVTARTAPQRQVAARKLEAVNEQLMEAETVVPAASEHSQTRYMKIVRNPGLEEIIARAAAGDIPADVLSIDTVRINRYFKEEPDAVASWPGFSIEDEPIIARR